MDCINLKTRFGSRFKVRYAEDYYAQHGKGARVEDPVYMEIPCRHGFIAPWDDRHLVACTRTSGAICRRLKSLPGVIVHQDGTDGANIVFPVENFDQVAEIIHPRRVYRLSAEERRRRMERLAKYQFRPAEKAPQTALISVGEGVDGR